jgi:hypothetical protein
LLHVHYPSVLPLGEFLVSARLDDVRRTSVDGVGRATRAALSGLKPETSPLANEPVAPAHVGQGVPESGQCSRHVWCRQTDVAVDARYSVGVWQRDEGAIPLDALAPVVGRRSR